MRREDVPLREGAHRETETAKAPYSYRNSWLEAGSSSPDERPIVLFNTSAVSYVEVRSQSAGHEQCRVVFTNGSEYVLHDAERAGNLLRQLRDRGIGQV